MTQINPPWSEEDHQMILDNLDMDVEVLAEKLGRPPRSVMWMRTRLTKMHSEKSNVDYDTRPDGWYEETVGQLLIEYKPAFDAWKHYHSYVEVVYLGEVHDRLTNWVTLKCRREADGNLPS